MRTLIKKFIPTALFRHIEPFGHLCEAVLLNIINGFPARNMKVIGITGTNGKTTTAFLVHRMLYEAGYNVGLMSTVAWGIGGDIKPQLTHMTSPTVPVLMKRFKAMRAQNVEWVVLETTSHALAQHRVWGVPYSIAVLTNITHEHLSYHGTFERYVAAKRMLFTRTKNNTRGYQIGVINADDPNAQVFKDAVGNAVMYGTGQADLQATDIKLTSNNVSYTAVHAGQKYHITCQLPGSFNVYNSLAAVGVGEVIGLTPAQIEQGIAALPAVEGRMTRIDEGQDFSVIVDYAHTPDSFEKLFKDIKPTVKGKLRVLFGSLGGGDEAKRSVQGELAGTYADEVVITEEDNRTEDPARIKAMIAEGVVRAGKQLDKDMFMIDDRARAIRFIIGRARKGDTVLLLGKGHEKTREDATGEHPWDEIGEAHAALKELKKR